MNAEVELTLAQYIIASRVLSTKWASRAHWEAWAEAVRLIVRDEEGNLIPGPRVQHFYLNGPNGFEITPPVLDENYQEVTPGVYDSHFHVDTRIDVGADPAIVAQLVAFMETEGEDMPEAKKNNHETGLSVTTIGGDVIDRRTISSPSHQFL